MSDIQDASPEQLREMLDIDQVLAIVPLSRSTLFRMERARAFPKSYYPSPNRRFWYADEIAAWQRALPPNSRIAQVRARRANKRSERG